MGDKWLKSLWIKNNWKQSRVAKYLGHPDSTVSAWFRAGVIPLNKSNYPGISRFLQEHGYPEMTVAEVDRLFELQKREHGMIAECLICGDEYERRQTTRRICRLASCRIALNKTNQPDRVKNLFNKYKFSIKQSNNGCPEHVIGRQHLDDAVKRYLQEGGQIEQLTPGIADGVDAITIECEDAGFRD